VGARCKRTGVNAKRINSKTRKNEKTKTPKLLNLQIGGVDRKSNGYRPEFNSFASGKIVSYLVCILVPG
jgi:hypothetical protein